MDTGTVLRMGAAGHCSEIRDLVEQAVQGLRGHFPFQAMRAGGVLINPGRTEAVLDGAIRALQAALILTRVHESASSIETSPSQKVEGAYLPY